MRIHVYSFAFNESRLVPFFLRHYGPEWVEKITIFDNHSKDNTVELLYRDPRVQVRTWGRPDVYDMEEQTRLRDECWCEARDRADWVGIVDFDELHWCPQGMPALLAHFHEEGVAVVAGRGRQMVSDSFPEDDGHTPILDRVRRGVVHAEFFSKPAWLRPDVVSRLDPEPGLHYARPVDQAGRRLPMAYGPLCLHMRLLSFAYYWQRSQSHLVRTPESELGLGHGVHLVGSEADHRRKFEVLLSKAFDVLAWEERYQAMPEKERKTMPLPPPPPADCLL